MSEPEYQVVVCAEEQQQAEELGEELPRDAAGPAAEGDGRLPRVDDAARDRPGALDPADRRRRRRRPAARARHGQDEDVETPGWDDLYDDRDGRRRPQDDPRSRRHAAHPRAGHPPHPARAARRATIPYLVGEFVEVPDEIEETKEVEALTRNVQALFARIIGLVPYLPGGAPDRRGERRRPERALPPRRLDAAPEDRARSSSFSSTPTSSSGCARSR